MDFETVVSLLPHNPPMVFLDGVENYDLKKRAVIRNILIELTSHYNSLPMGML